MFTELRAHTAFSFGDGVLTPESLAKRARQLGHTHLAVTDTADVGGLVRFALAMQKPPRDDGCADAARHEELGADPCPRCERPLVPIAGAELVVDGHPAAFLARDAKGYRNLATLVTLARVGAWEAWEKKGQGDRRGRPRVTWAQVAQHSAGLHALTGPASGMIASRLHARDDLGARETLRQWREVFDASRLSVEVQLHHVSGSEAALAGRLIALAEHEGIPWVVAHDPRYVDADGRLVHDVLTANRHGVTLDEASARGLLRPNGEWALASPRSMVRRWSGRTEGLRESRRIAEECEPLALAWMRPPMPVFPPPVLAGDIAVSTHTTNAMLRLRTYEGAHERWGRTLSPPQEAQLEKELELIARLGFGGFFLVMWDAVRFARSRNILCQGRGSAANSAVAFCLGITAVDPVRHGLLFERFLSEIRADGATEPPDIDVDFEHERREEVLDYMYATWGRGHAAIAAVTQTYRAPNAVRDTMRAFGYPLELADALAKRLHYADPAEGAHAIREALGPAHGLDVASARGDALLRAITALDGVPRLRSTHVGGFVLSSSALGSFLPVEQTTMGRTILQFDKDDLDDLGVPKFDFLGLGALTMTRKSFDAIEARGYHRPAMYTLPQDDAAAFALIQRGETVGTFQIESRAQIQSVLHTKPDRLYDLVVQVALIRPGPIQAKFVHPYTERRLGREAVTYPHPALEPILRRTQGIPIFQEQAMSIAMVLGGYTASEADALRRTMGNERKKTRLLRELERLRLAMVRNAAVTPPVTPDVARRICDDLQSFANYGFPESHAWSFALIAYATAWLKAQHPAAFYLGLLNAQPMGFYPVSMLVHDARKHAVEVRPPCLQVGMVDCTLEDTADPAKPALRIGWRVIRGAAAELLARVGKARAAAPFRSVEDAVRRCAMSRAEAMLLARAGAFGAWAPDRRQAAWEALRAAGDVLPLAPARELVHTPTPLDHDRAVLLDYHATGLSLQGHPMDALRPRLQRGGAVTSRDLPRLRPGQVIAVGGLVTIRQRPSTAGGTIFLLLEDEHGVINVIVSPKLVALQEEIVKRAPFVLVQGKLENDGAVINVVARRLKALEAEVAGVRSRDFR